MRTKYAIVLMSTKFIRVLKRKTSTKNGSAHSKFDIRILMRKSPTSNGISHVQNFYHVSHAHNFYNERFY